MRVFKRNIAVTSILMSYASIGYADEVVELSRASVQTTNYFLWGAVIVGVIVGYIVHSIMHKKYMAFDKLLPIIPAILVGVMMVYLPQLLSSQGDFSQTCFQSITDNNGQIRESIHLADECVLSREEISAWGIGSVISGYKGAFGYTETDRFLSTGTIYFFYYFVVAFWIVAIYSSILWLKRKLKN